MEISATGFSAGQGQSTHLGVPRVAVGELRRGCATSPYPRLTYLLLVPCFFPLLLLSLSSRALASRAAVAAAPAISDRRASIPSTHTCLASSSTHPRAHLSRSTAEIASPSTWPLEDSPHMSISLPAFFAQTEHGVSITASPSTFPSPSFFHSERWAPICASLAETGTTGFVIRYHRFC